MPVENMHNIQKYIHIYLRTQKVKTEFDNYWTDNYVHVEHKAFNITF